MLYMYKLYKVYLYKYKVYFRPKNQMGKFLKKERWLISKP